MRLHPVSAPALGPPGSGQLSTAHPALLHGYLFYFLLREKLSPGKQPLQDTLYRSLEMAASHSGALNTGLGQSWDKADGARTRHTSARGPGALLSPEDRTAFPRCPLAMVPVARPTPLPTPHAVRPPGPPPTPHAVRPPYRAPPSELGTGSSGNPRPSGQSGRHSGMDWERHLSKY